MNVADNAVPFLTKPNTKARRERLPQKKMYLVGSMSVLSFVARCWLVVFIREYPGLLLPLGLGG